MGWEGRGDVLLNLAPPRGLHLSVYAHSAFPPCVQGSAYEGGL